MQSVVPSIRHSGAPIQFTTDVTEKLHSINIKDPVQGQSNNHGYDAQICCHLDRAEKCHLFDLATSIQSAGIDLNEYFKLNHGVPDRAKPDEDEFMENRAAETDAMMEAWVKPETPYSERLPCNLFYAV
jgi:hypothetical protein